MSSLFGFLGALADANNKPGDQPSWFTRVNNLAAQNDFGGIQSQGTARMKDYEYFSKLPKDQQDVFLNLIRAQPNLNLGDRYFNPVTGEVYPKGLPPSDLPETKGAQERAKANVALEMSPQIIAREEEARKQAEAIAQKNNIKSLIPNLNVALGEMYKLADQVDATLPTRAYDYLYKQIKNESTPNEANRTSYESKAKNLIFPILKQTLGSQFTEKDRDELVGLLTSKDDSPEQRKVKVTNYIIGKYREAGMNPVLKDDGTFLFEEGSPAPIPSAKVSSPTAPATANALPQSLPQSPLMQPAAPLPQGNQRPPLSSFQR